MSAARYVKDRGAQMQKDFELGHDTERWWKQTVKPWFPHLKHVKAKGYDFRGVSHDDDKQWTMLVDTKFCVTRYRKPGWIEVGSWGKMTGIFKTAAEYVDDGGTDVFLVVMDCGKWWSYDVKQLASAIACGVLPLQKQTVTDSEGRKTEVVFIQLKGWDDDRFVYIGGPMDPTAWKPQGVRGKSINISDWMVGRT